jgi:tetratricopeptide (TPR) repeat protein
MDEIRNIILQVETLKWEKDFESAIAKLEQALSKYSEDYRLYEELADIYLYMADYKKSIVALDFALSLNPDSATGNYLKWFILLSEDKIGDAINYLEKSNKLFGNNAEVLRNLGWAYTMSQQHERGIIILKRALNISPEDELITEDLAMALIGTGDIAGWNKLLKKIGKAPNRT